MTLLRLRSGRLRPNLKTKKKQGRTGNADLHERTAGQQREDLLEIEAGQLYADRQTVSIRRDAFGLQEVHLTSLARELDALDIRPICDPEPQQKIVERDHDLAAGKSRVEAIGGVLDDSAFGTSRRVRQHHDER
jgi:hypothetical protein